tara:strand:+ start:652 stop:861 length:210 start_codon:yes stop_codon:yes gene_type:complete
MKDMIEKNLMMSDYMTMVKVIQATAQRGAIRPNEMKAVGELYEKLEFHLKKLENEQKEKTDGGLSKTNN